MGPTYETSTTNQGNMLPNLPKEFLSNKTFCFSHPLRGMFEKQIF